MNEENELTPLEEMRRLVRKFNLLLEEFDDEMEKAKRFYIPKTPSNLPHCTLEDKECGFLEEV